MKRIILSVLAVLSIAVALVSPYSVFNTKSNYEKLSAATAAHASIKAESVEAKSDARRAQLEFDSNRTFEVGYGDIERLQKVLNNVATFKVSSVVNVDVKSEFKSTSPYQPGENSIAVKFSLEVEDTVKALAVLNKCELPIYSLYIREPNIIEIVFLTGGGVG